MKNNPACNSHDHEKYPAHNMFKCQQLLAYQHLLAE